MALPVDTQKFRFRENGRKIRRARHLIPGDNGQPWISQERFAERIGTGRRHLIKLENGEHRPSGTLRDRIVEITGTTEKIEASDDDEEDALSVDGYVFTVTGLTVREAGRDLAQKLLRDAQRQMRRARQIEKALA